VTREEDFKYTVAAGSASDTFDAVVIAVPLELAEIKLINANVDDFVFSARDYQVCKLF